jgi:hypothetical protein
MAERGVGGTGAAWRKQRPAPLHRTAESSMAEQIENLQDEGDKYTRKIEIERRRNHDLDRKIKVMKRIYAHALILPLMV